MTTVNRKLLLHKEICERLTRTYAIKNADYGDSYARVRQEVPESILYAIYTKYSRIQSLLRSGGQRVSNEGIEDSLLDLANYCILELIEREGFNE